MCSATTLRKTRSCRRILIGNDTAQLDAALKQLTAALRPWTIDFHVAQNDATVHGTGSHDKTGRHCLPNDPNAKLDITKVAGYWLRDDTGQLTRRCRHICWDGCMFPNRTMMDAKTWHTSWQRWSRYATPTAGRNDDGIYPRSQITQIWIVTLRWIVPLHPRNKICEICVICG